MRAYRGIPIFILAALVSLIATMAILRGQENNKTKPSTSGRAEDDFYTVTAYEAPESADPRQRARRKRHNLRAEKGVDPKRFKITEDRGSAFGGAPHNAPQEPALPAAQSDLVVIGEVMNGQAYLSEDKVTVFSGFTIRVNSILKKPESLPLSTGDLLEATRAGGGVQFPSGKIARYGQHGKPLPRTGRQYLFFLRENKDESQDYSILTAYELRDGRIYPLDGINQLGNVEPPYAAYQKYSGTDEASFLHDVRDAILRNLGGAPERGGALQ